MKSFNLAEAVQMVAGGLEDMLVRGAYLAHHEEALKQQKKALCAQMENLRTTQPPFLFLRPRETRFMYENASEEARGNLVSVDLALALSGRLCEHLCTCTLELLEKWLRVNCDDYRARIEIVYVIESAVHVLARLEKQAQVFQQSLRVAKKRVRADLTDGSKTLSPASLNALEAARTAASAVENGVVALAANTDNYEMLVQKISGEKTAALPRIVNEPYSEILSQLPIFIPENADKELDQVVHVADRMVDHELGAVHKRLKEVLHEQNEIASVYVRDAWTQLHTHAMAHSVELRHVHEVVAQTERIYHMKA